MHNAMPRHESSHAVFAHMAIPKEKRVNAEQAVVSQSLHDWDATAGGCVVNRGRPQRKKILDVEYIVVACTQFFPNTPIRFRGPQGTQRGAGFSKLLNLAGVMLKQFYGMSVIIKQSGFGRCGLV